MINADSEIDKILDGRRFHCWRPAAILRISGEDSFGFLQGQFTNDLRQIQNGGAVYGLFLNHKGRVLADAFIVHRSQAEFWLVSYFSSGAEIRARLETFIVADDVVIEDLSHDWRGLSTWGDFESHRAAFADLGGFGFVGRRSLQPNLEWLYPVSAENDFAVPEALMGVQELTASNIEKLRIFSGIPAIPGDIGPGELPNEAGLEMAALSYAKGCYVGQEVMARLKTMGQVRRRLMRVEGASVPPAIPAAIYDGGRKVGELRSAVSTPDGFLGLALLTMLHVRSESLLSFTAVDSQPSIRVLDFDE